MPLFVDVTHTYDYRIFLADRVRIYFFLYWYFASNSDADGVYVRDLAILGLFEFIFIFFPRRNARNRTVIRSHLSSYYARLRPFVKGLSHDSGIKYV